MNRTIKYCSIFLVLSLVVGAQGLAAERTQPQKTLELPQPRVLDESHCYWNPNYKKDQIKQYEHAASQLRKSWMILFRGLPTQNKDTQAKINRCQNSIREVLADIYRIQPGRSGEADFISKAADQEFAEAMMAIDDGKVDSFPSKGSAR